MIQTPLRGTRPRSLIACVTLVTLAAIAALTACGGGSGDSLATTPGNPPVEGSYKAEVRRTAMGVPHIKADTWGGAGYGYGYAQAEDNLCTMADSFLTYRGERSQYFGADALLKARSTIGVPRNIDSDFFHRHVISADVMKAMVAAQPDNLKKMVEGFTAGYNRYVRDNKSSGNAHAECRNETWVAQITSADIYRRMYAANLAGGHSNFVPNIANAMAPAVAAPAKVAMRSVRKAELRLVASATRAPELEVGGHAGVGSNMIGFGTAVTGDASPLLFGNPHWYWRGPDRFYQAQLTIPGELNVSGTSFLGVPIMMIGFNDNIAWSHTVSTASRFGLYELKLASGDPTSYMRDGSAVKMQPDSITVNVRQADGSIAPVTRTLYSSEYGPLVNLATLNPGLAWNQSTAFAIRDINSENYRTFRNWMRWNQAKSLDEFIAIQREELAVPWINTVAIGRGQSKAWYADVGAVPNVSTDQVATCTTAIGKSLAAALPRVPTFDGSRSACDWQTDAHSVQKGALGLSRMPSLMRDDYVANMNDSYWLANPKAPMTSYPAIMGPAGTEPVSFRTRLGNLMAQGRIDGGDGYPGKLATVDVLQKMVLNSRVHTAELFKSQALAMVCATPKIAVTSDPLTEETFATARVIDTAAACDVLTRWDNTGVSASRGAHVWDEFWNRAVLQTADSLYAVPFSAADPIHTPRDLKNEKSIADSLRQAFGAAVLRVQASGYALDAPRGEYLFVTRGGKKIPLYGGCDSSGYFTVACSENSLDQSGYDMDGDQSVNRYGNSYMQIVRFPEGGVDARTFLTFSQSDEPASAHNADYTQTYSAGQWLKVPFSEAEIAADKAYSSAMISE